MFGKLKQPRFALALGVAFSAIFLWLAAKDTDLDKIYTALSRSDWRWGILSLGALTTFCVIKAMRWSALLGKDENATAGVLLPPLLIGYMATSIMPMQLGEILRAHSAGRRLRRPLTVMFSSMIVERVFDVLGIVSILAVTILLGVTLGNSAWVGGLLLVSIALCLLALLVVSAKNPVSVHKFAAFVSKPASKAVRNSVVSGTDSFLEGISAMGRPRTICLVLFLSILQWISMWACVWVSLVAVGIATTPVASLAVLVAVAVGMMLPAGPGHIGTFQLAFTLSLSPFDVPDADALAASVFYQIMILVPVIVAGALFLRRSDLTFRTTTQIDKNTGHT